MDEVYIHWDEFAGERLGPTLQTRTARSCAFSCAFCSYPERAGNLALAGVGTVEREFDAMREMGTRNVVFIDDTFNVPLARFKDLCRLLIRKQYEFRWFSVLPLQQRRRRGVRPHGRGRLHGRVPRHRVGIADHPEEHAQGGDASSSTSAASPSSSGASILTFGSFILGFPGETAETVRETRDFIRTTGLDYYRTQMWYYEHGTPIAREREQYRDGGRRVRLAARHDGKHGGDGPHRPDSSSRSTAHAGCRSGRSTSGSSPTRSARASRSISSAGSWTARTACSRSTSRACPRGRSSTARKTRSARSWTWRASGASPARRGRRHEAVAARHLRTPALARARVLARRRWRARPRPPPCRSTSSVPRGTTRPSEPSRSRSAPTRPPAPPPWRARSRRSPSRCSSPRSTCASSARPAATIWSPAPPCRTRWTRPPP